MSLKQDPDELKADLVHPDGSCYRILFERSDDAILLLRGDRVVEANPCATELFRLDRRDILSMRLADFFPPRQPDGQDTESLLRRLFDQAERVEDSVEFELSAKRSDETPSEVSLLLSRIPGRSAEYRLAILRDRSEHLATSRMFENYRAYLSVLAEMRRTFYGRGEEEIVRSFLVNMTNFFGFSKAWYGELLGNDLVPKYHSGPLRQAVDVDELRLSDPGRPAFPLLTALETRTPAVLDALDRNPGFSPWNEFARKSGLRSLCALPFEIDDRLEGGFVVYSDRFDRFDLPMLDYLQNAIRELERTVSEKRFWEERKLLLRAAKDEAEYAAEAKSRFLANMSHEIRTPMTAILGYTEVIADPETTWDGCREAARIIRSNAEYLLQILNDVLDFSKIEADKLQLEIRPVRIVPLLQETVALYARKAAEKKLPLVLRSETRFPEQIRTDSVRLKQVLLNLVGNAIKFTDRGSVEIVLAWQEDERARNRGTLQIEVRDTGIGISGQMLPSIFSAFQQADDSTTRKFGGTGLGLAISQRLVRALGGTIQVESEPDRGTTFTIRLPQHLSPKVRWQDKLGSEGPVTGPIPGSPVPDRSLPLSGCRILLAEDGADSRRLFKLILDKAGAEVQTCENGNDAFETTLRSWKDGRPFDLVLMDMQMPVMDGYSAVDKLRRAGYVLPIVALTAHARQEEKDRCLDAGCDDCVMKPILREALIEVIQKNLRKTGP